MGIFSAIAAPSFSPYLTIAMDCDAKRGLEVLALAVTAYHLANGRYPQSLEALVPEFITAIPPDPFEKDVLKMKLVKGGVDLYSSGPTKDSEQGKETGPIHFYLGKGAYQEYRINSNR
jgi:type II secretory pathway pseudopilin PulG